jgi:outer membrane lipoprotein-sorting protein
MVRKSMSIFIALAFAMSLAAAADNPVPKSQLSAADIVNKNVAARGGLQSWRAVESMAFTGTMGAGGNQRATLSVPNAGGHKAEGSLQGVRERRVEEVQLPFEMDLARPHKSRVELQVKGQAAIQVYDGTNGWKLRPFLNRLDVEPYTAEETKIASTQSELDGFLVDYAAKGTRIDLDGIEKVEDRETYKLKLTLKSGDVTHVWVDGQTFLETKIEGHPRRLDGTFHPVEVFYRDYRNVSGLEIPFVLETRVLPVAKTALGVRDTPVPPEKVTIEKVVINPKFDATKFSKPAPVAPKAK